MAQQINLYNPIFLKQKRYFSAATMAQALGLVAAGTLAVYGYAVNQARTLTRLAADTDRQVVQQREQLLKLGAEMSPQGRSLAQDEIDRATAQVAQRRALLETMRGGALGNTEGFSPYLTAFARQTMPGVWLTGLRLGGGVDEVAVSGRALKAELVPAYIRALSAEPALRGRSITDLKLAAREPAKSAGTPATTAPRKTAPAPERYVEFDLVAPRQVATNAGGGDAPAERKP